MRARDAGIVAVGLLGIILVVSGLTFGVIGTGFLYTYGQWAQALGQQEVPIRIAPPTQMFVWSLSTGFAFVLLGGLVIWTRERIVDSWLVSSSTPEKPETPLSIDSGATAAVGIFGLYASVNGLSEVFGIAVNAWLLGWDSEATQQIWASLPFLVGGTLLLFRPRLVSGIWRGANQRAG